MPEGTVLVAGAGFSAGFGYPLTHEIPKVAFQLLSWHRQAFAEYSPINEYRRFLREVQKAYLWNESQRFPRFDFEDVLTALLNCQIEWKGRVPPKIGSSMMHVRGPEADFHPIHDWGWHERFSINPFELEEGGDPDTLFRFTTWVIGQILLQTGKRNFSDFHERIRQEIGDFAGAITTNYDVILETIVGFPNVDFGYEAERLQMVTGVRERGNGSLVIESRAKSIQRNATPILKIHGSQDQCFCQSCKRVLWFPPLETRVNERGPLVNLQSLAWTGFDSRGTTFFHDCQDASMDVQSNVEPLLVPPVSEKSKLPGFDAMNHVLKASLRLVEGCERLVVIGSAVRPSDDSLHRILRQANGKPIVYYGAAEGCDRIRKHAPQSTTTHAGAQFLPNQAPRIPVKSWGNPATPEFGT